MKVTSIFCDFYSVRCAVIVLYILMCDCKLELVQNFDIQTSSKTGGIAVTDFDQDGIFEVIVAVQYGPNLILQFSQERNAYIDISEELTYFLPIRDPNGQTLSVCACDVDGDGSEEIFLLNQKSFLDDPANRQPNRLLKYSNGSVTDLLTNPHNVDMAYSYSGGFVTCLDHDGDGVYSIFMGSYMDDGSGIYKLFSVQKNERGSREIVLQDISQDIGLNIKRDGISCVIGPFLNDDGYPDIFVTNSNEFYKGSNLFRSNNSNSVFQNQRNGLFVDAAALYNLQGDYHSYDSAAIADLNGDELLDLLVCSFYGPTRKYLRNPLTNAYQIGTADSFTRPTGCKNLLEEDFDNDGQIEVFKDDEKNDGSNENAVFEAVSRENSSDVNMKTVDISEHLKSVNVQGITVADLNGDGLLELIIAHKLYQGTTLSIYQESGASYNNWLRVMPLTPGGAPARGSKVTLTVSDFSTMTKVIGGGCSRVCQTEPVSHFGLGNMTSFHVKVTWSDGHVIRQFLSNRDVRKSLQVYYTGHIIYRKEPITPNLQVLSAAYRKSYCLCIILLSFVVHFISVI